MENIEDILHAIFGKEVENTLNLAEEDKKSDNYI
jgi:hypothetical protein